MTERPQDTQYIVEATGALGALLFAAALGTIMWKKCKVQRQRDDEQYLLTSNIELYTINL